MIVLGRTFLRGYYGCQQLPTVKFVTVIIITDVWSESCIAGSCCVPHRSRTQCIPLFHKICAVYKANFHNSTVLTSFLIINDRCLTRNFHEVPRRYFMRKWTLYRDCTNHNSPAQLRKILFYALTRITKHRRLVLLQLCAVDGVDALFRVALM